MTEEEKFIEELKALAEVLKNQGLSNQEIQIQLDAKKAEFKSINKGKQTAVPERVANATAVNEQIATGQSMGLESEDTSLELDKINKINQNFSKETNSNVTSNNEPLDVNQANNLIDYTNKLAEDKKKLRKEKDVVNEIFMDKTLPRKYEELDQTQLEFLEQQAASVLIDPSLAETKLKSIDIFNKVQKGITSLENETGGARFLEGLDKGAAYLGEAIASIPETLIDVVGLPLKGLVELGVLPENTATTAKELGITNPIMDYFIAEQEKSTRQLDIYDKKRFKTTSPTENFQNGDYYDGFVTMGNAIGESAGVSISFMYGGATSGIAKTGKFMTAALTGTELRQQREENPEQSEFDNITKSIALAGAESFFSAVTQGSLGKVYKDILFKQGKQAGEVTFKNGLVAMYQSALKKYGLAVAPIGEGIEEVATQITQNAIKGMPLFQGVADAFVIGMGSGGIYGAPITVSQASQGVSNAITRTKISNILKDKSGPSNVKNTFELFNKSKQTTDQQVKVSSLKNADVILKQDLDTAVTNGDVTQNQADNILKNFYNTQGTANRVKSLGINESMQTEAINLLKEKEVLDKAIKRGKSKPLADVKLGQVETINNRLREISKESSDLSKIKDIATTKKFAKGVGFQIVEANNEANQKALEEAAPEGFDIKNDYGFISGKQIFLNNKVLDKLDNYEITTASHELLHGVLTKSLLDKDLTKENIEEFIEKSYGKVNLEFIKLKMSEMGYDSDYLDSRPDEYLTQLYDANLLGEEGNFEKAARYVEKLIRKASGGKYNWSFATKDDLGSFLRSYKESFETGTLSKRLTDSKFFNEAQDTSITASSLSKKDSDTVNKIYADQGLTSKSEQEILKLLKPTAKGLAQRFRDRPSFDQKLVEDQILTGKRGMLEVVKSYPKYVKDKKAAGETVAPLSGYINNSFSTKTGFKRYIDNAETIVTKEFTQDISTARGVTDTTTEKTTEKKPEKIDKPKKPRVSLRKQIEITPELKTEIVDAVVKVFGTRLPPIDSPKFEKALTDSYKTLLFKKFKNMMGTRSGFESFLRDNFETIIEAIPQSVINKRFAPFFTRVEGKGGKQAREGTAQGNAVFDKKKIVKAQFISYFLGRNVKPSNKGTRKDALAETLAMEFSKDATPQTIKRADVAEKMKLVNPTVTQEKVSKIIDRTTDFAFSKKQIDGLRLFQAKDIFESSDTDFAANNEDWKKLSKIFGFNPINMKTAEGRKQLLDDVVKSGLASKLPKIFWTSFQGTTDSLIPDKTKKELNLEKGTKITSSDGSSLRTYGGNLPFKSVPEAEAWIKNAEQGNDVNGNPLLDEKGKPIKVKFPEPTKEMEMMLTREPYTYTEKGKSKNKLAKDLNNPAFIKRQDQSLEGLKQVFDIFQTLIKEDAATNIPSIIALLSSTSSNMNHFVRTSSPVRFYQKSFTGKKSEIREEHTLPASLIAKYLFIEAAVDNVDNVWPNVKRNFFQGALSVTNDNKLAGDGVNGEKYNYKEKTPPGWTMDDNIWSRYFNPNVADNNFGISPNEIMLGKGKSVYDSYSVNSSGDLISRGMVNSIADASSKNRNMLPKSVQPLKGVTNNEVLSEMQNLDNQANEARAAFSKGKNLSKDFNEIIEKATGIGQEKQYGKTKARAVAADKGKWDWAGIPPSAQDFVGLTRYFAGKGKKGDETIAWIKENFLDPFARANIDISNARVALANDFKGLKKLLNISPKDLNKKIPGEPYTIGNAIRVYTWTQQGMTVPGLSKTDAKVLNDLVEADSNLVTFANELININKDNGYPKPGEGWLAGTITTDLLSGLNTVVRAKYLKQWQNNVNEVFTEANMNKLEAAYGSGYRDALENMLGRMKTGSNRGFKGDTLTGRFVDWLNGSIGAIMFFNMRSAVLQTISAVNFVNWSDNNPLKAAAAFGNQPQYWGDVVMLMNSDYLVERRNGLKININEADIAEIAAESKNKAKAFINKILKLGFLPTQIADSFAIASGGATFYRNRVKSLKKEGMSQKEAEAQAFQDFREVAEESQQSSRPDRISAQQAGPMGRVILAFANTPAQYARLMQKAASDLKNRRGDDKTNISKIIYYGAIQNVIFNALQQALFAMAFGDEEPDEEKKNKKYTGIVNGMADSLLRGIGFHGAAISTLKNVIMKLASGAKAQDAAIEMLDISPPVSSKIGKLKSAGRTWDWNKKEIMEKGWSLDNPAYLAAGQVVSAATNVPLDRGIRKLQNLKDASDAENEEWMRVANALGWAKWELEWEKDKPRKKNKNKRPFGKTLGKSFGKKLKL